MKITTDMTTEEIISSLMEASREGWPVPMEDGSRILLERFASLEALAALIPELVGRLEWAFKYCEKPSKKSSQLDNVVYPIRSEAYANNYRKCKRILIRARALMQAGTESNLEPKPEAGPSFSGSLGNMLIIDIENRVIELNLFHLENYSFRFRNPISGESILLPERELTMCTIGESRLEIKPIPRALRVREEPI